MDGLRRVLALLGYAVHRWPANRFDAMGDALALLAASGYRPRVIVDAGAHLGRWARLAHSTFPEALLHLIEPQPRCHSALGALAREIGRVTIHRVAVTEPGIASVWMIGGDAADGTGGRITRIDAADHERAATAAAVAAGVECPAATLDALLADSVSREDRALLKLDLEGHEMPALGGARRLLDAVEVVVAEVPLFEIDGVARPVLADVQGFLRERGFDLYDVAALSGRPRDRRLRLADLVFARRDSALCADRSWR